MTAQLLPPNVQAAEKVDAITIHVTPHGPWPTSITHAAGPLLLYVSNRSGTLVDTYSLVLKPLAIDNPVISQLQSLLDLHFDLTSHRDQQLIRPLPGDYELHFQSHPDWVVSIRITAK